jgi:hypothetical protein
MALDDICLKGYEIEAISIGDSFFANILLSIFYKRVIFYSLTWLINYSIFLEWFMDKYNVLFWVRIEKSCLSFVCFFIELFFQLFDFVVDPVEFLHL